MTSTAQQTRSSQFLPRSELPTAARAELARRELARRHLMRFGCFVMPDYSPVPHLDLLADRLEAVERGELKRLMVFLPPRHGKSTLCSILFPSWYLGRNPQAQFIGCSHTDSLAYSFSYATRETILSPAYQRLWRLGLETAGVMNWQLSGKENRRASYISGGIGSGITGEGANILLIDDPVKDAEQAASKTYREKAWDWYRLVAHSRLEPDAAIVLVMTRWNDDDLAGRLLRAQEEKGSEQWRVLQLKAITEGNALWPQRYPLSALEQARITLGGRDFECQYQGNPSVASGNIFKREWWRYYTERPEFKRTILSLDTAFKTGQENDYTVATYWGETATGYYLLDVWRQRVEFPELKRALIALHEKYHPNAVLVEDAASGQSLIQEMRRDTRMPILPIKVSSDKVARANAVTPLIEAGRVYLPEHASWVYDYVEELSAFPNGEHDDQVDPTTQALNYMRGGAIIPVERIIVFDSMREFGLNVDL